MTVTIQNIQEDVEQLVAFFRAGPGESLTNRQLYEAIVVKLNHVGGRDGSTPKLLPWTYRYVEGVHKETIKDPSPAFRDAVARLGASLDSSMPPVYEGAEPVQVFAIPGKVQPGSMILGNSRRCDNPRCRAWFVPDHPARRYCPGGQCQKEARKAKKEGNQWQ